YAYLDDAPIEERRTQTVMSRRWLDPQSASDIGKLDADAIQRVRAEAWPDATNADELHDALSWLTYLTDTEVQHQPGWPDLIDGLVKQHRVTRLASAAARDRHTTSAARSADPGRQNSTSSAHNADASRQISSSAARSADASRQISTSSAPNADASRQISTSAVPNADASRHISGSAT